MKEVRERIHDRRKELNLTADDVAAALGLSRATIYRYESDAINKLPTEVLVPLARVLQTTPAWLMGWDDDTNVAPEPENIMRDDNIAALTMAALKMSRAERQRLLDMAKLMFPKAFED